VRDVHCHLVVVVLQFYPDYWQGSKDGTNIATSNLLRSNQMETMHDDAKQNDSAANINKFNCIVGGYSLPLMDSSVVLVVPTCYHLITLLPATQDLLAMTRSQLQHTDWQTD
jgi:hypothetical protein